MISNQSVKSSLISPVSRVSSIWTQAGSTSLGAAVQPARRRFQPGAGIGLERGGFVVHLLAQQTRQAGQRARRCASARAKVRAPREQVLRPRDGARLPAYRRHPGRRCGRGHGGKHLGQENFARARAGSRRAASVQPSPASAPAACTASSSASLRLFVIGDQVLEPFFQSAHAGAGAAFRSADPAAQLRHLAPRQQGGEAAVGGIEQMMAFVEDIAQPAFRRRVGGLVGRPASPARRDLARPARSPAHDWRPR